MSRIHLKTNKDFLAEAIVKALKEAKIKCKALAVYRKRLNDTRYYNRAKRNQDVMRAYHELTRG